MALRTARAASRSSGQRIGILRPTASPSSWCACHSLSVSTRAAPIQAVNVPLSEIVRRQQQQRNKLSLGRQRLQSAVAALTEPLLTSPHRAVSPRSIYAEVDPDFLKEVGIDPDELLALASQKPTPLRLADMYKYGRSSDLKQRLLNAQYLHREMPIRIAQRAVDLLTLPHGLSEAKPIRQVAEIYLAYLKKLQAVPCPKTQAEEDAFTDLLQAFVLDRTSVPMSIARGVSAWRDHRQHKETPADEERVEQRLQEMEEALYRFFTARVGLRFLTEHHVLSSRRPECQELRKVTHMFQDNVESDELGCIQSDCNLVEETRKVADLVIKQTTEYYGLCPPIEIVDCQQRQQHEQGKGNESSSDNFTYVTHHLHYMLAELLKNSCRATVQQYIEADLGRGNSQDQQDSDQFNPRQPKLSPIRVIITKGEEDVTIKIADKGGGIPRSMMNHIWKFGHSHHSDEREFQTDFGTVEGGGARIRGFGLPLARIYARYFGGELNLKSMEGYGVDAYLHLPRLGSSCENLPLRVRASPGERDSTPGRQHTLVRNFSTSAIGPSKDPLPPIPLPASGNNTNQNRNCREQGGTDNLSDSWKRKVLEVLQSKAL